MAKNVYSLQLLRNTSLFANKQAAIEGITSAATQDGVIKLARYAEGEGAGATTKTIFGIYHDFGSGDSGYTIYDSYKEVIEAIQEKISGSTDDIEEINKKLGTGVTTANTVTSQLAALSGDSSTAQSGDTSVEGAKKYTDGKIEALDYTDTAVTGSYVSKVDESNGVITVTREELPTVAAISEAGKPITAVSESLGAVSATAGTINAEFVNVADSGNLFTGSTVEAVLAEIDAAYKAADAAIIGGASASGNTLGKLEDRIDKLATDAKEYSIKQITTGLSTNVKEAWGLFDAGDHQSGATISIYKDSAYKEIYLGTSTDTINTTTGEITKQEGDKQSLNYAYMKADGTYDLVKVDVSAFISESEFASGVTATDHIVRGVVDSTSEKDSQSTPVDFLTVGANGFKVSGIKDEIDRKIAALDASVTGGTTAGTATADHIQVVVDEADGKLTAVTVTEANIADADDLAELSAKTVTEIASSNSSITVATATTTAADGTVKYDVITDASKIKMSGFTAAQGGFTDITPNSSVTDAIKEIETAYIATNAELDKKIEKVVVNGVTGTVANHIQDLTIDGHDVALSANYEKATSGTAVETGDTIDVAIGKLEKQIDNAVAGGLQEVEAGSGITVTEVASNKQTISVKLKADAGSGDNDWHNPLKFDETDKSLYFDSLDCGTY